MRLLILLSLLSLSLSAARADECSDANCKLPSCHCCGTNIPGNLTVTDVPQMVMLTFDDAVTKLNFNNYYVKTIFNRKNPDGCQISVTYFATHEYNDYNLTNRLYREGHEIALHSISHQPGLDYWGEASVEDLEREFIDQRDILMKFGLIPTEALKGTRAPYLKLAGDNTFKMMQKNNIMWDCSMPTMQYADPAMWPYTLDYPTQQDCPIPPCPTSTFPGLWEVPMVDWSNDDGIPCPMVDTCPVLTNPDELYDFIIKNFERHYKGNRAPFPFFMHAAWFAIIDPMRMEVYNKFLDYLGTLDDVYIVSISRMLEWVQKPTPLSAMKTFWKCWTPPENKCVPRNCELVREDTGELRYMMQCGTCPKVYPWLGNPNGDKKN